MSEKLCFPLEVLKPLLEIHGNSTQHVMLLVDAYLTFSQEYMMPPSVAPQLPLASKHEPGVVDETYFDTAEFEALGGLGWKRILVQKVMSIHLLSSDHMLIPDPTNHKCLSLYIP